MKGPGWRSTTARDSCETVRLAVASPPVSDTLPPFDQEDSFMTRSLSGVLAVLCALAGSASAQTRAGGEFRVNSYTTGTEYFSSAGRDASGNFVVVWTGQETSVARGQRFDRAGVPVGAEFAVSSSTGIVEYPSVAMGPRGDFLVVWAYAPDFPTPRDIMAQAFSASGARVGAEFRLNQFTTSTQTAPTAAADGRGNFAVVWWSQGQDGSGYAFLGRRVSRQGVPIGSEFVVNTYTTGNQTFGDVAAGASGDFVVGWSENDESGLGVMAQRFDAAGTRQGGNFRVNTTTTGAQAVPGVAVAPDGSFVIAFLSTHTTGADVYAQRYAASGAPIGGEFQVNSYTTGVQGYQHLSMDSAGNFVVDWIDYGGSDGSSAGVRARRFRADGTARGADFLVNTYTTGLQIVHKAAAHVPSDAAGNFVVTWFSEPHEVAGTIDVYAQRYGGLHPQSLSVDSAGNLVWEPGETVAVRPAWFNASGAAQAVSGGLANLTGPAGPTYTITDATGAYGTIANNATQICTDCYAASVSATRPATHWDATAVETLTPDTQGQAKKWALHVGASFTDVPTANAFYRFIETVLHHGVTAGCTSTQYCPGDPASREQMAVFVLVAKEGEGFTPPACGTPLFNDVPAASPFCRFVEELARRGVVNGCGGGNFCPAQPVTREQMAVFLLRTLDPTLNPPACTEPPRFPDVPVSSPFCRWVEELFRRGVTGGCGGGNFCPQAPVTREQMAVFLAVTFGLTLYGP
jgi:hypothetical protein